MVNPGWNYIESPFHQGERTLQERLGVRDQAEKQARRIVRDYLTEQHRVFFAQLPFVLVGAVDPQERPWASILFGPPGFLFSPDAYQLRVAYKPRLEDPLAQTLIAGAHIGLLGIELHSRRRNRLNGVISTQDTTGFTLQVGQSFGNCPRYIQTRDVERILQPEELTLPPSVYDFTTWGEAERRIINRSDTFFIATAFQGETADRAQGADVSHRGGKPGFVRIEDDHTLTIPDYPGNGHFNTLGNLVLNPRAGLLFIDFRQGDLLYMTGTAELIWDRAAIQTFAGAERLLRFYLTAGRRVVAPLPLRWSDP